MTNKFSDEQRAAIARGWAVSGLPQDEYAATFDVTGRCLRSWLAKYAPSQPPLQRVEAILVEMVARVQAVLDDVRAEQEDRAEAGIEPEAVMERAKAVLDDLLRQERLAERAEDHDQVAFPEDRAELEPAAEQGIEAGPEPAPTAAPSERRAVRPAHPGRGFFEDFR